MKPTTKAYIAQEAGKFASDLIRLGASRSRIRKEALSTEKITPSTQESSTTLQNQPETALETNSLDYQLDRILDELQHLETEHLPAKGRLKGIPCDCIAKASRDLRRHARETIPIAAREQKDATIFSQIADEANYLMEIGTVEAVKSGKYDAEYLSHSGIVSNFRKIVDKMLADVKSKPSGECSECEEIRQLSREWIKRHIVQEQ